VRSGASRSAIAPANRNWTDPERGDDRERRDPRADRVRRDPGRAARDRDEAHDQHAHQLADAALAAERESDGDDLAEVAGVDDEGVAGEPERVAADPGRVREDVEQPGDARERGREGRPGDAERGGRPDPEDQRRRRDEVDEDARDAHVEDGPRVAAGGEAVLDRLADRADGEDGGDDREVGRRGPGERRVRAEEPDQLLGGDGDGDRDGGGDREGDEDAVERDAARARLVLAARPLGDEDLRPDRGDDDDRAEERLHGEAEPDRRDRVLAHSPEPERVDEGVRDVDEVLRDERGREQEEHPPHRSVGDRLAVDVEHRIVSYLFTIIKCCWCRMRYRFTAAGGRRSGR